MYKGICLQVCLFTMCTQCLQKPQGKASDLQDVYELPCRTALRTEFKFSARSESVPKH